MTQLQQVGLALAVAMVLALELAAHEIARKHWKDQRGVFWRQGAGLGIILTVGTGFSLAFALPPLLMMWGLSVAVGVMLLLLNQAKALEFEPWEGYTEHGNLRRQSMHTIEDLMAVQDRTWARHKEQERDLVMWRMLNVALRQCDPTRSLGDLERMADEVMRGKSGE